MMKKILFTISLLFIFTACSVFSGYENDMIIYQDNIYSKKCDISTLKKTKNDLFFLNQAGSLARFCKEFKLSNELFDKSEEKYKNVDLKGMFSSLAQESASTLTNENVKKYDGTFYERIMINIYKALNFLSLGDYANARVEFNRALQRQVIASEHFKKQIDKAKKNLDEQLSKKNISQAQISDLLTSYDKQMSQFLVYPDFINPFASYLAGIFFYSQKDYSKAEDLFEENLRMNPNNIQIKQDLQLASKASSSINKTKDAYIWLIYEAGNSIGLKEENYTLPIVLEQNLYNIALALPSLTKSISSFSSLSINGQKTVQIADMNAIIAKEFNTIYPLKVRKAILNATGKVLLQAVGQSAGDITYILAHLYTAVTNKADIRYLSSLPSNFQSARIQNKGQNIILRDDFGNELANMQFQKGQNGIIYVKSLNKQSIFIDKIEL